MTGTASWTASIAATSGASATWSGSSYTMDFNDNSGVNGQMTIDPSGGTITAGGGNTTGVSAGSSSAFNQGVTDSITLYSADGTATIYGSFDLTGVNVSQSIPAEQEVDDYGIDMTLTVS